MDEQDTSGGLANDGLAHISRHPGPAAPVLSTPAHELAASAGPDEARVRQPWVMQLALFIATCASTYFVAGLGYAISIMVILGAHELGHYFQARRYGVPVSLPFFIPMPLPVSLVGTMGAFITMRPGVADRRSLFDISITGPVCGLIPAILFSLVGLRNSTIVDSSSQQGAVLLGEPILFKLLEYWIFGPLAEGQDVALHPLAYAGWVGIFITGLNLIPVGQLDGGHILYTLIGKKSHVIAVALLTVAAVAAVWAYRVWFAMLVLLILTGLKHPPTADDSVPLGPGRIILGWLALGFVFIGFTPVPFTFQWPDAM